MLLRLQNLLKRDPSAYRSEFHQQKQHFRENLGVFSLNPAQQDESRVKDFAELVSFMAHAAPCYRKDSSELPGQLLKLLSEHRQTLEAGLRLALAQALIQLQNRSMIDRMQLLPVFFSLFEIRDARLRELIYSHIIGDIRRINQHKKNPKLNGALQNYMYRLMRSDDSLASRKALEIMIDLYGRRIWNDEKTVNAICLGCFSNDTKILCASLRFLLGRNQQADDEKKQEAKVLNLGHVRRELQLVQAGMLRVSRKKKRARESKRLQSKLRRAQKSVQGDEEFDEDSEGEGDTSYVHPIELIYDPQAFTERLFSSLKRSTHPFTIRMLMMNTISRLIGARQLLVFNFYPFLQKYLQPHQRHVTAVLSYIAQASHRMVPPDVIQPILATLAQHFITDRNKTEAIVVGLNAVREICSRCPLAMNRELLHDLAEYRKSKEKSVMMAARSIIALYREENPELLQRRDRGRSAAIRLANARIDGELEDSDSDLEDGEASGRRYGEERLHTGVKGAELLEQLEAERKAAEEAAELEDGDEGDQDEPRSRKVSPRPNKATKRKRPAHEDAEDDDDDDDDDEDEGEDGDDDGDYDQFDLEGLDFVENGDDEADDDEGDADDEADEGDMEEMDFDEFMALSGEDDEEEEVDEADEEYNDLPTAAELGISAARILTDDDFRKIEQLERQKHMAIGRWGKVKKKREDGNTLLNSKLDEDLVTEDDIKGWVGGVRPGRPTKEDRMAAAEEGRDGRPKFGVPTIKGGGSTNAEKQRMKAFLMVSRSSRVRGKQASKFSLRQKARSAHIKNLKVQERKKTRRM